MVTRPTFSFWTHPTRVPVSVWSTGTSMSFYRQTSSNENPRCGAAPFVVRYGHQAQPWLSALYSSIVISLKGFFGRKKKKDSPASAQNNPPAPHHFNGTIYFHFEFVTAILLPTVAVEWTYWSPANWSEPVPVLHLQPKQPNEWAWVGHNDMVNNPGHNTTNGLGIFIENRYRVLLLLRTESGIITNSVAQCCGSGFKLDPYSAT